MIFELYLKVPGEGLNKIRIKSKWRGTQNYKESQTKRTDKRNVMSSHADFRSGEGFKLGHMEQTDPGLTSSDNLTKLQSLTSSSSCRVKELNISWVFF